MAAPSTRNIVPPITFGPIFLDVASSSLYQASLSSYSWTHPGAAVLENGGVLVAVAIFATGTVTAVTYGGTSMRFVRSDANGVYRSEIWRLETPAAGSQTVAVTLSLALTSIASAVTYFGVDQANMVDADAGDNGLNSTPTKSVTTIAESDWVVSALSTADTTNHPSDFTQQERVNKTGALGTGAISDRTDIRTPASTTMTWEAVGALDSWALSLVALRPPVTARQPRYGYVNYQDPGIF
jgi:hypothetical protein